LAGKSSLEIYIFMDICTCPVFFITFVIANWAGNLFLGIRRSARTGSLAEVYSRLRILLFPGGKRQSPSDGVRMENGKEAGRKTPA
jgi:hypothetical protein